MQRNQKSIRGGIQDFLFPFSTAYVTQWSHGNFTHKGTCAMDFRGSVAGAREPYFAPADAKCVWVYPSSGQAMWQTINDVRCPNGYVGKVTFMTVHDDSFDCKVGMTRSQGMQIGNMGTKGYATGVHCHLQIAQTSSTRWYKNKYGIYQFDNEVEVEDACFMDGSKLLNWNEPKLRETKDVPVEPANPVAAEAAKFGYKVGTKDTVGRGFFLSEAATIYGRTAYGVKIPQSVKDKPTYYTSGGVCYDRGEWWVLAKEIMSWVKVSETIVK